MQLNVSPPDFSNNDDRYSTEKIKGYLSSLQNQLSHMLLNIEEDNLSDNFLNTIKTAANTAEKINWLISNNSTSDSLFLTDSAVSSLLGSLKKLGLKSILPTDKDGNIDLSPDLSSNNTGLNVGKKITFSSKNEKNNIYINSYGNLVFDTAKNSLPFSLALNYNDTGYFLEVFDDFSPFCLAGAIGPIGNLR